MQIFMIGDSIMQTNYFDTFPQTGWGQMLNLFLKENVKVNNFAKNGTSSKSFLEQGLFKKVEKLLKKGDLLIIGFAHNDEKEYDKNRYTEPYTTFQENLKYFIDIAKCKNAEVILTTPVIRRKYQNGKLIDTHLNYVDAIKECAKKNQVSLIDLNKLTTEFFNNLDEESSKKYFMNFEKDKYENYILGRNDDSHLTYEGAYLICKLFVSEIYKKDLTIKKHFLEIKNITYCSNDIYEK